MKPIFFLTSILVTIYKCLFLLLRPSVPRFQLVAGKVHVSTEPSTLIGAKIKNNQYASSDISIQHSVTYNNYSKAHKKTLWYSGFEER